mgnify:CR=1 FL=1
MLNYYNRFHVIHVARQYLIIYVKYSFHFHSNPRFLMVERWTGYVMGESSNEILFSSDENDETKKRE